MAAPYDPPVKGEDYVIYVALYDAATPSRFKSNPTIASGDFKVSKDGGALANLTTLPAVTPAGSVMVKISLSATEMTADNVTVVGIDQTATPEWSDICFDIRTVTTTWAVASDIPSAATVADAVWDEDATGHQTQGTFGQAIGDPVADTNTIFKAVVTDATGATVGVDAAAILDDTGTSGVVVASINANAITASAIAANAIGSSELADGAITAAKFAANAVDAVALSTDAVTEITTAVWNNATRILTAIDEDNTTLDLDATIRAAVGLAAANLDTQLSGINAKTTNLPSDPADASDIAAAFSTLTSTITASFSTTNGLITAVDDFVDTEVAAIKAKTDLIPGTMDGKTLTEMLTLMGSVLLGKASGLDTLLPVYRSLDDSKNRVSATVDAFGNRSSVTLDAS